MANSIINIALPVVNEIIDDVLANGSMEQEIINSEDSRDRLATFVLSRLPARYMTVTDSACSLDLPKSCYSAEQHQQMRQLVHQGIQKLSTQPTAAEALIPSTWFG
ncbi:MAG: late competence development ComFB family protein [Cyanobacteria bacterium P01_D01_bin.156]